MLYDNNPHSVADDGITLELILHSSEAPLLVSEMDTGILKETSAIEHFLMKTLLQFIESVETVVRYSVEPKPQIVPGENLISAQLVLSLKNNSWWFVQTTYYRGASSYLLLQWHGSSEAAIMEALRVFEGVAWEPNNI